jgi:hypothetical protein
VRPRFRGLIGILLLALEDPLSCALSFFQSTREYVSGKVQAGTQQILLLEEFAGSRGRLAVEAFRVSHQP